MLELRDATHALGIAGAARLEPRQLRDEGRSRCHLAARVEAGAVECGEAALAVERACLGEVGAQLLRLAAAAPAAALAAAPAPAPALAISLALVRVLG